MLTYSNLLSFFSHPHGYDLSLCTLNLNELTTFSIQLHNGNHSTIPQQNVSPFVQYAKQHQLPVYAHPKACLVRTPSGNAAFDTFLQAQQQQIKANQQAYDQAVAEYQHQQSVIQAWAAYEQKDANLAAIANQLDTVAHQAAPLLNGEHQHHLASLEREQTTHEKQKHALERKKNASIKQHQTRMDHLHAEKTQLQSEQNNSQMQLAAAYVSDYERYQQQQHAYEQQLLSYRAAFEDYHSWQRQNPAEQARTRAAIQAQEQTLASLNAHITLLVSSSSPDFNHLRQLKAQRTSLDASLAQLKRHRCFITRSMPVAPIAPKEPIAQCTLGKGLTNLSYAAIKLWHTQQTNQYAQRISHTNHTIQEEKHRHQQTLRDLDASICKHQTAITCCKDKTKRIQDDFNYLTLHIRNHHIYSMTHGHDCKGYYQAITDAASQHKALLQEQRRVQSIQKPTEAKPTDKLQQPIPTGNAVIDVPFSHVTLHYNVNDWKKSIAKNNSVFSTRGKKKLPCKNVANHLGRSIWLRWSVHGLECTMVVCDHPSLQSRTLDCFA